MAESENEVRALQWLVDTRALFPGVAETKQLETVASPYLALLSQKERTAALKYLFPRDAKLSLASSLLKRHAIRTLTPHPWHACTPTFSPTGKPIFTASPRLSFNVSHQDGLVALLAIRGTAAEAGLDVVSCAERRDRDREAVFSNGWAEFVKVYEEVFAPGEVCFLAGLEGRGMSVDMRLRYFYALWCLREAYVKMTGEALLADWLKALEFRDFRPPDPAAGAEGDEELVPGEVMGDIEVWRDGKRQDDVRMELRAFGSGYMVGVAVRTARAADAFELELGTFEVVGLEEIRRGAEKSS